MKKDIRKKRVILVSGCFDILHTGHIRFFQQIKHKDDMLVVNVVPDWRVKQKKGKDRPILSWKERGEIMQNIKQVELAISHYGEKGQNRIAYEKSLINWFWDLKTDKKKVFVRNKDNKEIRQYCQNKAIKFRVEKEAKGVTSMHSSDIIKKIQSIALKKLNK